MTGNDAINTAGLSGGALPLEAKASTRMTSLTERQEAFAGVLSRARDAGKSDQQRAREAAEDFVAVAFVQPVLKQLRESDRSAAPFNQGPAEKQFRSMMDAAMAKQMVRASNFPLVERVAEQTLKTARQRGGYSTALPTNEIANQAAMSAVSSGVRSFSLGAGAVARGSR
ncbi:MAG: rod-binding protein [Phycisphaerales bacterium]|nr:rod-binding protein [Phycisphaerales bacterium]